MTIFIISDIHYDFYLKPNKGVTKRFFEERFSPADTVCIAGDIANTFDVTEIFLREISKRYRNVVLCLGNHDLAITWDSKHDFKNSEEKILALQNLCDSLGNVHLLDGRVETIDGVKFGGAMGMWDFSFLERYSLSEAKNAVCKKWCNWFDGVHWDYCEQNLEKIRSVEFERLNRVLEQKPDVVLTHFAPLPQKMQPYYEKDIVSSYFYFDNKIAEKYLLENPKAIWCAGHTHTAFIQDRIFVNPNAYPEETPRVLNKLHRKDFLLEEKFEPRKIDERNNCTN